MKFVILVSTLCLVISMCDGGHSHHHHAHHIGFFWDDFKSSKILKAVKGGRVNNENTYIGLVKHVDGDKELLIPGVVEAQSTKGIITYEFNKQLQTVVDNFKILCTDYPDHMEWISTNTNDIKQLFHEKELIPAGSGPDQKYYIGRIQSGDDLLLGKVVIDNNEGDGFHTISNSIYIHITNFEVLIHEMK